MNADQRERVRFAERMRAQCGRCHKKLHDLGLDRCMCRADATPPKPRPVRHAGLYCVTCGMAEGHWNGCTDRERLAWAG